jgi:hypothetical protein
MGIDFPITVSAFLTIAGTALFAGIALEWLKRYNGEWRFNQLIALVLAVVAALVAQCIAAQWKPGGAALFEAVLMGFFGASVATFGYEGLVNVLGLMGFGKRAATK